MDRKKVVSLVLKKDDKKNLDVIKNEITNLHKYNKSDVPEFLDELKENNGIKEEEEVEYNNEFLKYML